LIGYHATNVIEVGTPVIPYMSNKDLKEEFTKQVMASQGIVHKVCRMYCDGEEDRKDLFQEILIQLWKSYPSFRGDSKFSSWMYRVGLNVAISDFRKSKTKKEDTTLPASFDNLSTENDEQSLSLEKSMLRKAIQNLNDIEKGLMMLYLEEKPNEEIAEIMGITQNYVRVKMTRIRTKLKETLNPG
jgi:RNA polymerase sigma-70 factor (ECF subfamily)